MTPNELDGLRAAVETKFGSPLKVHTDFNELSLKLGGMISLSTLKRIWGYNKDHQNISLKSVNILAQYLGYENYDDFINSDSLASEDHQKLYAASKVAMLAQRVHRDRFKYVHRQFSQCQYQEALQTLSTIDDEIKVLMQSAKPYIDSTISVISELCLKVQTIWSCHNQEDGTIEKICEIFEQAIPLAKSINDHFSLWYIYEHWAYWMFLREEHEMALELNELGIKQATILYIEKEGDDMEDGTEYVHSLCYRSYFLIHLGEYQGAIDVAEEAMNYSCDIITQCYILLNYAKANAELQEELKSEQKVDYEKIYREIIEKVEDYHTDFDPTNESIHLLLSAYFSLGVYNQECLKPRNESFAADCYRKAIEIYNSREIPDLNHQSFYEQSLDRLQQIESLSNETI